MKKTDVEILRDTLGEGCNVLDRIVISDFSGVLQFVRGVNGPAPVQTDEPYTGAASDYDGTVTLSCPEIWGRSRALPLRVGDEYRLPECIGKEIFLSYAVVENVFTDVLFLHSQSGGVYARA